MKEIYYWMMFYVKKSPSKDAYEFNSFLLVYILSFGNICSIGIIIKNIFNIEQKSILNDVGSEAFLVSLVYLTIMYLYLFLKRKEIQNKYDQLSEKRKKRGLFFFWMYILFLILCWFIAYLCIGE